MQRLVLTKAALVADERRTIVIWEGRLTYLHAFLYRGKKPRDAFKQYP